MTRPLFVFVGVVGLRALQEFGCHLQHRLSLGARTIGKVMGSALHVARLRRGYDMSGFTTSGTSTRPCYSRPGPT